MALARIHRWLSKDKKITYEFGSTIPLHLFQDDTAEKLLSKIYLGIQKYHQDRNEIDLIPKMKVHPYAWSKNRVLRFEIKDQTVPLNPWDANEDQLRTMDVTNLRVVYKDNEIVAFKEIHVVFADDLSSYLSKHPFYFPGSSVTWNVPSIETIFAEDRVLSKLWTSSSTATGDFTILKASFRSHQQHMIDLPFLFEKMHTTAFAPFLQLVEDETKVLYKLYHHHRIATTFLDTWTSFDRVPKVASIVAMIAMTKEHQFARVTIQTSGEVHLQYAFDARDNVSWSHVEAMNQKIEEWLLRIVQRKIKFQQDSVSVRTSMMAQNMSVATISKHLGKFVSIFHVNKIHDGVLEAVYKRSNIYQQKLDISDYILSRINVGIPVPEIVLELLDMHLSREDVDFWISQYQAKTAMVATNEAPRKKTLSSSGCMIKISKTSTGFNVYMERATSYEEALRIFRWLQGTLHVYVAKKAKPSDDDAGPGPSVPPPRPKSKSKTPSTKSSPSVKEGALDDDDFDFLSSGGALGKNNQRYFNTQLIQADPNLFVETASNKESYSRQCAANNFRQPVVISKEEKERLATSIYKDSVDDTLLYGSDDAHQNYYMCPRIWCPMSRIPLTQEQLDANGGKCPGPHSEEPILAYKDKYWDMDPKTKHHIGFLANKSQKGLCLPCCFKRPLKDSRLQECKNTNVPVTPNVATNPRDEEMYIMGAPAPLPKNRYGIVPKSVHELFQPTVAFALCSKSISTTPCYVRRGVGVDDDTFMTSVSMALGMQNKNDLLKYIQQKLDPWTFICLENGNVLKAFSELHAMVPHQQKELLHEWKRWIKKYPAYAKHINIDQTHESDKLSRELGIYKAYRNFLQHLRSSDPKNPQHLVDFFFRQGIMFIIWKKKGNHATLMCPYFRDVNTFIQKHQTVSHAIMLIQDGEYFEPVELKRRGAEGIALHPIESVQPLIDVSAKCPAPVFDDISFDIFNKLIGLDAWIQTSLQNPKHFQYHTVIIRPDFTLFGILTNGHALIILPRTSPIAILSEMLHTFKIQSVVYLEDIQRQEFSIKRLLISDVNMMITKLQQFGFGINLGTTLPAESSYMYNAQLTIPEVSPTIYPVIRTHVENENDRWIVTQKKHDLRWREIAVLVAKTFMQYYDTLVKPVLSHPKDKQITILLRTFPSIPERDQSILQQVMEEMPYADGSDAIHSWLRASSYQRVHNMYISASVLPSHKGKEWMFSQTAVDKGIPWSLMSRSNGPKANDTYAPSQTLLHSPSPPSPDAFPCMLQKDKVEEKALPSKFRNHSLGTFKIWKHPTSCKEWFESFVKWLSKHVGVPVTTENVMMVKKLLIAKLLATEEGVKVVVNDPSGVIAWEEYSKKKFKKPADLWTRYLSNIPYEQRVSAWMQDVSVSPHIFPSDIDWYILSQLLAMNVLVLQRGKYGAAEQLRNEFQRGNLTDLAFSSMFFNAGTTGWKQRPCIVMYKDTGEKHHDYYVVVDKNDTCLHKNTSKLPKDILDLLNLHVTRRTSEFSIIQT